MAWSEYSSSKKDSGYVLLTVYWGDDLNWNKTKEETKSKTIKDNNYKTERNKLTAGLRYDILKRDGFKCQICGRSSEEDGVKLHVDHIIPISKGGKTTWDNLRTLCQDCNLGKSNKLEN